MNICITHKFDNMIQAFECDFVLARDNKYSLSDINLNSDKVKHDIELLEELSYLIRNNQILILKEGE